MKSHFYTSVVNSGAVTVFTSVAMTLKNIGSLDFSIWLLNWIISWAIVCTYVYFVAPIIGNFVRRHNERVV